MHGLCADPIVCAVNPQSRPNEIRNDVTVIDVVLLQTDDGGAVNTGEKLHVENLLNSAFKFEERDHRTGAQLNDPHTAFAFLGGETFDNRQAAKR
jgi:hypothetical protein